MNSRAKEIVQELDKLKCVTAVGAIQSPTQQIPLMGELMVIVAEEQAVSAEKLERQTTELIVLTRKVVRLTWGLFWLTCALLLFTAVQLTVELLKSK